ncbi:MAG: dUTP diphosphatase [Eubacteriaceae bacterium]|nr:dUTP diphosphatase [Eubacteriaceae bacterium]MDD4507451.1 dUTP diphosphatase [Eubacteriaceae bacterium]
MVNKSGFPLPEYQSKEAAGIDLRAAISKSITFKPHKVYQIPTGIFLEIPPGFEGQIRARSGLALRHGITLVNGIGTIDSDYRGEICVIMMNLLNQDYTIEPGDRIAQLVFSKIYQAEIIEVSMVSSLKKTDREDGGFGHSGRK